MYGGDSKTWVIQVVGSLMTLGPTLAYVVAGPLASSLRKRHVMAAGAVAAAVAVFVGAEFASRSPLVIWGGLFVVGAAMGIFSAGKMSAAPLEAERGTLSIFAVNAGLSVAFLCGILSGAYFGTLAYEKIQITGVLIAESLFLLTAALAFPCRYETESRRGFGESARKLGAETASLLVRFPVFLTAGPLLWGVGGAVVLAVTAYAEVSGFGGAAACSLMPIYAAVGAIVGNLVSPILAGRRFAWSFGLGLAMAAMVAAIPAAAFLCRLAGFGPSECYFILAAHAAALGGVFGAATNLVDAEYLRRVRLIGAEGAGAALQSAMIAVFSFIIGGIIGLAIFKGWLSPSAQFLTMSLLTLLSALGFMVLSLLAGELDGVLRFVLSRLLRMVLGVRYKVRLEGMANLPSPAKGLLVLPNHPAEVDPLILVLWLWPRCWLRPVVTERFFTDKIFGPLIKLTGAFPMPDMEAGAGRFKNLRIERTIGEVISALKAGDNVLLYPAGRLASSGFECLGATSGVSRILQAAPDAKVVLISTRGLRGSTFSKALTGGISPNFAKAARDGARAVLRNLIFLTPKREVALSIEAPTDFPKDAGPLEINRRLESFYNSRGEEPLSVVPLDFWTRASTGPVAVAGKTGGAPDIASVDAVLLESVIRSLSEMMETSADKIKPESRLSEDLGADSLRKAEILVWLEEEYFASNVDIAELRTVADVVVAAAGAASHEHRASAAPAIPAGWLDAGRRPPVLPPSGSTLHEAFLECCDRMGNAPAIADDIKGIVGWRTLKTAALVLANVFRRLPGEGLGIMLPASAGASTCAIATLLAGKVPVMMNWTVGRRNLEAAAKLSGVEKVITSGAFLDKLVIADFGDVESKLVFIEDLVAEIGLPEKLTGFLMARCGARRIIKDLGLEGVTPDKHAVILFTSGSEAAPKGVPLSHGNIMSNLRSALEVMSFESDDVLLGILPPFHAFGFMACIMFPLTSGLKTAYYPNPTDGRRVSEALSKWRATAILGTPTFIASTLKASREMLTTLRLIIVGAEKAPASLFETVEALGTGATVIEGYGITECSPALALNLPGEPREGVGKPLPGVELLIVDSESHKPLPKGERGLVLARGPCVFSGYIGGKPDPFVEVDGKKWYSTGDLGRLSPSGCLVLAGRMKRFVKIGGEMVSLPAIEEALAAKWPPDENGPVLAVGALEKENARAEIWLFTTHDISVDNANEALKEAGFSNLSRIGKTARLEAIPLLGSGKTDHKALFEIAGAR